MSLNSINQEAFSAYLKRLSHGAEAIRAEDIQGCGVAYPNGEAMAQIAEAVKHGAGVKTLDLNGLKLQPKSTPSIVSILKSNPSIDTIDLSGNRIDAAEAYHLGVALGEHKNLSSLTMRLMSHAADFIENTFKPQQGNPNFRHLDIASGTFPPTIAVEIGDFIGSLPNLEHFTFKAKLAGSITNIIDGMKNCPSLTQVDIDGETANNRHWQTMHEEITSLSNPNLLEFNHPQVDMQHVTSRNHIAAQTLHNALSGTADFASFAPAIHHSIDIRQKALEKLYPDSPALPRYREFRAALPKATELDPQSLLKRNGEGFCPLDNPDVLKNFPQIHAQMQAAGNPLTADHLRQFCPDGRPRYEHIAGCVPLAESMPLLNGMGLKLQDDALLKNGQPTPLLHMIFDRQEGASLFTRENCSGLTPNGLRQVKQHMPENQRAEIGNYHQLLASLEHQQRPARGR